MGEYLDLQQLFEIDGVLAILSFGSEAKGAPVTRDVDVCIVAPQVKDKAKLLLEILSKVDNRKYDVWLFEELPAYMKAEIIKDHKLLWCTDLDRLYSYFADFMRTWRDQEIRIRIYTKEL